MKKTLSLLLAGIVLFSGASVQALELSSVSITQGKPITQRYIFNRFGCTGGNISPGLSWKGAPEGTKSFAITAYDPDAPTGSGWWHWLVFNIPATETGIPEGGTIKGAVESRTDFGKPGYGGPCPPVGHGTHHYSFTVFALDVDKLELDENVSGAMVGYYLNQHTLDKATIMATFER
jgi:Raf kinase inhibitor-like YbhB/YbcL family protein